MRTNGSRKQLRTKATEQCKRDNIKTVQVGLKCVGCNPNGNSEKRLIDHVLVPGYLPVAHPSLTFTRGRVLMVLIEHLRVRKYRTTHYE